MFISFLGCDGSGKSAVIAGVSDYFRSNGTHVTLGHWRPKAFSNAKDAHASANADDPHGQQTRGCLSSVLKLGWLWLNWWVGWFLFLKTNANKGLVIFDRFHADMLVDPTRYRYGGPLWLARLASRLMPQPDKVFFLDASPAVLLSRKQEVSKEALEISRKRYLELAVSHPRIQVIDASQPLNAVVSEVVSIIKENR
jgi:thymidylate kinase